MWHRNFSTCFRCLSFTETTNEWQTLLKRKRCVGRGTSMQIVGIISCENGSRRRWRTGRRVIRALREQKGWKKRKGGESVGRNVLECIMCPQKQLIQKFNPYQSHDPWMTDFSQGNSKYLCFSVVNWLFCSSALQGWGRGHSTYSGQGQTVEIRNQKIKIIQLNWSISSPISWSVTEKTMKDKMWRKSLEILD